MGFGSDSPNGPGKAKISDFIFDIEAIIFGDFFEKNILRFNIPMNKILFVDAL